MSKFICFIAVLLTIGTTVPAQMVQQLESFESATPGATAIFPSPGWRQLRYTTNVAAAFQIQAVATAANPAIAASPGGGTNVMMFSSYTGTNNDSSIIITKPFDFSNNGGVNPQFSFLYVQR
ncbi:MAG: hypothetical protein IPN36_15505 [Bacteroidetes bacterium]|nr:hypothetical protein [Bacteroidota bacterium]